MLLCHEQPWVRAVEKRTPLICIHPLGGIKVYSLGTTIGCPKLCTLIVAWLFQLRMTSFGCVG